MARQYFAGVVSDIAGATRYQIFTTLYIASNSALRKDASAGGMDQLSPTTTRYALPACAPSAHLVAAKECNGWLSFHGLQPLQADRPRSLHRSGVPCRYDDVDPASSTPTQTCDRMQPASPASNASRKLSVGAIQSTCLGDGYLPSPNYVGTYHLCPTRSESPAVASLRLASGGIFELLSLRGETAGPSW